MRTVLTSFGRRWKNSIVSYKNFFFTTADRTHRSRPVCCINIFQILAIILNLGSVIHKSNYLPSVTAGSAEIEAAIIEER